MHLKPPTRLNRRGFTLIEIMISVGLIGLIAVLFLGYASMTNSIVGNSVSQSGKQALENAIRTTIARGCSDAIQNPIPADPSKPVVTIGTLNVPPAPGHTPLPGITDFSLRLARGSTYDVVTGGADLKSYNLRISPNGFRVIIPAGAVPEVSGTDRIYTGVVQLIATKGRAQTTGGDQMAPSIVSAIKLRIDGGNNILRCEGVESYICPEGMIQTGDSSDSCKTPAELLAGVCSPGEVPVTDTSNELTCLTPGEILGRVCNSTSGLIPVSNGAGGVECRSIDTLTVVCADCQVPIPDGAGSVTCTPVPGCAGAPPAAPICEHGSCPTAGERSYNTALNRVIECTGGCWTPLNLMHSCLPPAQIKKGDDEWMRFHQDASMRRPRGAPCEEGQISRRDHAHLIDGGRRVRFDDTSRACSNDQACAETAAP